MSWIVKNTTGGNVFINDVKLMFIPGEEKDLDLCSEIKRNNGSNDLFKLLKRGFLQTIYKGEMILPDNMMQTQIHNSEPSIQSTGNIDKNITKDDIKQIIKEVLMENKNNNSESINITEDIKEAFRDTVRSFLSEIKQLDDNKYINNDDLNQDSITAMIHSKRMDIDNKIDKNEKILLDQLESNNDIVSLAEKLRKIKKDQ